MRKRKPKTQQPALSTGEHIFVSYRRWSSAHQPMLWSLTPLSVCGGTLFSDILPSPQKRKVVFG